MRPSVTIVVPIHNEAEFLPVALPRLIEELDRLEADSVIILAENGSTDATAEVAGKFAAQDKRVQVLRLDTPDYGAAMRSGFLAATTEWVVNVDIDYFSGDFFRAGLALAEDADVVLASKRLTESDDRRSLLRRAGTFGFNMVLRSMFRSKVTDTHGMKMIRRSVVTDIAPKVISTRDLFDTELVIRAERAGHRIKEVPTTVEELRAARTRFVSRIPRTLRGLWRIRRALWRES